jgi:hypothetical protein
VCDVLWSASVLEEVGRHLPVTMTAEDREFLFELMNEAFPDALVAWPGAIDVGVRLRVNEKDRHVVAAALWGHADILLTDDAALHNEVNSSGLMDAQRMPVFLAYAIDSAPREATLALVEMARRRWLRDSSANEQDVTMPYRRTLRRTRVMGGKGAIKSSTSTRAQSLRSKWVSDNTSRCWAGSSPPTRLQAVTQAHTTIPMTPSTGAT